MQNRMYYLIYRVRQTDDNVTFPSTVKSTSKKQKKARIISDLIVENVLFLYLSATKSFLGEPISHLIKNCKNSKVLTTK